MRTPVVCLLMAVTLGAGTHRLELVNELKRAAELQAHHQYSAAADIYLSMLEAGGTDVEPLAPSIHSGLASVYQDLGQFEKSEKSYQTALQLFAARKQQRERLAIHTLINLGSLYWETQQYGRFRETCRSALDVLDGLEDLGMEAARLHQLVSMLARMEGRHEEARNRLRHAIAIWRALPGDHHLRFGDALNSLGALEFAEGEYREALAHFSEALAQFKSGGESTSRNIAGALVNIACTQLHLNKRDEATTAYRESLAALEATVGSRHHSLAQTMGAYAVVLEQVGMKKQAKAERRRAEAILASAAEPPASSTHVVDVVELEGHQ